MDEIWERAVETALDGQTDHLATRTLTLDGAVKSVQWRLPPPSLLEKFSNLQHLSVANIGFTSLERFPRLPNLQKLILSDNRISGGLEFLVDAGLVSLRVLDLSNNRIQFIEDLAPLSRLKLVSLDLYECPVTRVDNYRSRVFGLIKTLKYLDKMDAEENERPETDDEEDEDEDEDEEQDDEEDDDPGSGEIDSEERPGIVSNGHSEVIEGIADVDEDEESEADEEETAVVRGGVSGPSQNGFRVEERAGGVGKGEENDSGEEIDEEEGDDEDVVEVHEIDDSDDEEDGVEDEEEDDDEDDDEEDDDEREVHEIDDSDNEEDGVEDEDDELDVEDDDEEDVLEEVDNDEGDLGEPESTGRLTSTEGEGEEEGEIDGHEQGEEDGDDDDGEMGEEERGLEDDGEFDDEEGKEEDEDFGEGYLVQPVGQAEVHDAGGSDMEPGNEEDDMEGEEEVEDDDSELQELPSSSHHKRRRDVDADGDDGENDEEDDVVQYTKSSKKQR